MNPLPTSFTGKVPQVVRINSEGTTTSAENNVNYKEIFHAVPTACLILAPTNDFTIVAVNDAYLHTTMTVRKEILKRGIFDVFPDNPDDPSADGTTSLRNSLEKVLKNKVTDVMGILKYDIRKPNDEGGEFEVRYWRPMNLPVVNKNDNVVAIIHRAEDVTEFVLLKKKSEDQGGLTQELQLKIDQMEAQIFINEKENAKILVREEQERLRAKEANEYRTKLEKFIDMICHEIRNPLNGITGHTDLINNYLNGLKKKTIDVEMVKCIDFILDGLKAIKTCASHQKIITDDVLDFSRLEVKKLKLNIHSFRPSEVISSVISTFSAAIHAKGLVKTLNLPKENPIVMGDSSRVSQIIMNIVSNAIKYTVKGSIDITVRYFFSGTDVDIEVSVADTGIGMTNAEQLHLFERFFQANPKASAEYGGSGLGLFITKDLVELMDGEIKVSSKKDVGSIFTFKVKCNVYNVDEKALPNNIPHHTELTKTPLGSELTKTPLGSGLTKTPLGSELKSKTILIVEDNIINQEILRKSLELRGYHCHIANNGVEAIELFSKYRFDLIFMDIEMPVMRGIEATKLIREKEKTYHVPIICLSGYARDEYRVNALDAGMNDFVSKPFNIENLVSKIKKYCVE